MDFFEAQESAQRRTRVLILLFALAVVAIVGAVYILVYAVLAFSGHFPAPRPLFVKVAVITPLFILGAAAFRTHRLRRGGAAVAEMLGGRRVAPDTSDSGERRLVNVIEEMAIASGTPVPGVYLLPADASINAFAAGFTFDDAVIGVTRGAVDKLTRDELQGVVAHEFSHILHGDMRLNMRLIGLLYGILAISVVGRGLINGITRQRTDRARKAAATGALVGVGLVLVGSIGVFFGRLIQAAVSRQREFLADAASVQYTRNPHGLGRALGRIAGSFAGSRLENHHADEVGHLFFSNAVGRPTLPAFATHPPLEERIRRIGVDPAEVVVYEVPPEPARARKPPPRPRMPLDSVLHAAGGMIIASEVTADALVDSVGAPGASALAAATDLVESLPEAVPAAARDPARAPALLLALLAHDDDAAGAQKDPVTAAAGEPGRAEVAAARQLVAALPRAARLPLVDLLMPSLRALPPERRAALHAAAVRAIRADGRADLFEFAVYHIVRRQLASAGTAAARQPARLHSLAPLRAEVALLLSAVAWAGTSAAEPAQAAFAAGLARLPATAGPIDLAPRGALQLEAVDAALARVRAAAPGVRRRVLLGCATAAGQDGVLQAAEAEFVRAIAEAIDCPLPLVFAREAAMA